MDDNISRQAAIEALDKQFWRSLNIPICKEIRNVAKETIKALPPAQPERKAGQYIGEADGYADGELVYDIWSCSECGCRFEDWDEEPTYNFCTNCGADMKGKGET